MSGHSKWSKVKHQKAATDSVKATLFTKASHAIAIAVREGAGVTDPDGNFRLRLAIENARAVNMPKENIYLAIARAAAGSGSEGVAQVIYEGFAPGGVSLIIEAATDNRQRTVSSIRNVLEISGGHLGTPGSVLHGFVKRGRVIVPKEGTGPADLQLFDEAVRAGADDFIEESDRFILYTAPESIQSVRQSLESKGIRVSSADVLYHPISWITLSAQDHAVLDRMVEALEDLDDVTRVFMNYE